VGDENQSKVEEAAEPERAEAEAAAQRQQRALLLLTSFNGEGAYYQGRRCVKEGRSGAPEALAMAAVVEDEQEEEGEGEEEEEEEERQSTFRTLCISCRQANKRHGRNRCRDTLGHTGADWRSSTAPLQVNQKKKHARGSRRKAAGPFVGEAVAFKFLEGWATGSVAAVMRDHWCKVQFRDGDARVLQLSEQRRAEGQWQYSGKRKPAAPRTAGGGAGAVRGEGARGASAGNCGDGGGGGPARKRQRTGSGGVSREREACETEALARMLQHPQRVIGCLVLGREGEGEGSSASMRGVVVGSITRAAPAPAPAPAPVQFRVVYADGTQELLEAAQVQAVLADGEAQAGGGGGGGGGGCGAGGATCPVCFEEFGVGGGVRPSILECGHVFCCACVQCIRAHSAADAGAAATTRRGTCIRCPLCQARHRVLALN
jgi:hypothetical protein